MKEHRLLSADEESLVRDALFAAIDTLDGPISIGNFLEDLCTPAELQAMADRWWVAKLLDEGLTYREIHDRTGVSLTTIGRVARYVSQGAGGYKEALANGE